MNLKLSKQLGKRFIGVNLIGMTHLIDGSLLELEVMQKLKHIIVSVFSKRAYIEEDKLEKNLNEPIILLTVILFKVHSFRL